MKEDKEAGASLVQFQLWVRSGMGIFSETMYKLGHWTFGFCANKYVVNKNMGEFAPHFRILNSRLIRD